MESRAHSIIVGLLSLLLLAALILSVVWYQQKPEYAREYLLEARTSVSGLAKGSPVHYRGVEVGEVLSVDLESRTGHVLVKIGINGEAPITRGTYAKFLPQGVSGQSYVNLDDLGEDPRPLATAEGALGRIPVRPSILQRLGDDGDELLVAVTDLAQRVTVLLSDKNIGALNTALTETGELAQRLSVLTEKLNTTADQLPATVAQSRQTMAQLGRLSEEISGLSRDLRGESGAVERITRSVERVAGTADEVGVAVQRVAATADEVGVAVKQVAGTAGTFGRSSEAISRQLNEDTLPRANDVLENLDETVNNLNGLVSRIKESPRSLIVPPSPRPGPGEPGFVVPQ